MFEYKAFIFKVLPINRFASSAISMDDVACLQDPGYLLESFLTHKFWANTGSHEPNNFLLKRTEVFGLMSQYWPE